MEGTSNGLHIGLFPMLLHDKTRAITRNLPDCSGSEKNFSKGIALFLQALIFWKRRSTSSIIGRLRPWAAVLGFWSICDAFSRPGWEPYRQH